jgi:hypothetical protein
MQDIGVFVEPKTRATRPAAYGVLAAVATSLLWFAFVLLLNLSDSIASIPSLAMGPLVGYTIYRAADREGAISLQVAAGLLTGSALLLTEVAIIRLQVARELSRQGAASLGLLLPVDIYLEWLDAILVRDGLTQLFFVTTLWASIYITRNHDRG